jgi:hypothetical protein
MFAVMLTLVCLPLPAAVLQVVSICCFTGG